MNVLFSDAVEFDMLCKGVHTHDGLVFVGTQPVALEGENGEYMLFLPNFYHQFERDEHSVRPVFEHGRYYVDLETDDDWFRAVPDDGSWRLELLDPGQDEDPLVVWTESFTLS